MTTIQKKVCLLGDFAVGKTSLVRRFVKDRFDDKYLSTIGVKISRKTLERPTYTLNLLLWDLAGGDEYSNTESGYLRGAAGALIVCDLTRYETIHALERYTKQLRLFNPQAAVVLVANKLDLTDERVIHDEELHKVAHIINGNGHYLLSSAKTGEGVNQAFEKLATLME
ncbi:MAG: GTP-binding protein [Anaerolineales bacterium]|nr:GTP-binding protein [Anaerolineales bacterium]